MQQMMSVQPEENPGAFHVSFAREVHAPVHIFIDRIIRRASKSGANQATPFPGEPGGDKKRHFTHQQQDRSVPPSHGNGLFVFFVDQMISVIGLENPMMDEGVGFVGIIKSEQKACALQSDARVHSKNERKKSLPR